VYSLPVAESSLESESESEGEGARDRTSDDVEDDEGVERSEEPRRLEWEGKDGVAG